MEFIITENCSLKRKLEPLKESITNFFLKLISSANLSTVKKIVVTDYDFDNYSESVKEMSKGIDKNIKLTENGAAVVIDGINEANEFVQYIFIKGDIFLYFCLYLFTKSTEENKKCIQIACSTIFHEIGHCVYNELLYIKYNYKPSEKEGYHLSLKEELEEYIYYECINLTSEYFAQSFMYNAFPEHNQDYTPEILESVNDNSFDNRVDNVEKIYRLIYWFALYTPYYHINSIAVPLYEKIHNTNIVETLKKLENELIRYYQKFNDGEFNMDNVISIFKELYNIKYAPYDKI